MLRRRFSVNKAIIDTIRIVLQNIKDHLSTNDLHPTQLPLVTCLFLSYKLARQKYHMFLEQSTSNKKANNLNKQEDRFASKNM